MFITLVNDSDGILKELVHIGTDRATCEQKFIGACAEAISNWDGYSPADIAAVLDEGYAVFGGGSVMFIDASNCITDDELRDSLTGQPNGDMTVAEIVADGEVALKEGMTVDQILEECCGNLDSACSWEIQGQVLFKGSDGKWYTITTESIIGLATPEFVKDTLAEHEDD